MTRSEFTEKLEKFLKENLNEHYLDTETFYEGLGFSWINFNIGTNSNCFDKESE
tara:strand:- start:666 stop:827 length:162 start_codon:yes stop_codon:yes gene_type:complete